MNANRDFVFLNWLLIFGAKGLDLVDWFDIDVTNF